MSKYYECPTANYECPYWDWKEYKCAMEVMDGDSPAGQCDEYDAFNEEDEDAHNNLIRGLIEANEDIAEAKGLLVRALDQLYLLGYDSGFTNPTIKQLVTDIKFYLNGGKLNGT